MTQLCINNEIMIYFYFKKLILEDYVVKMFIKKYIIYIIEL